MPFFSLSSGERLKVLFTLLFMNMMIFDILSVFMTHFVPGMKYMSDVVISP